MPVERDVFERYNRLPWTIVSFLKKNKDKAYTLEEIAKGLDVAAVDVEKALVLGSVETVRKNVSSTTIDGERYFAYRD